MIVTKPRDWARIRANLARLELGDDPLFPTAILRGRRLVGSPLDERRLLAAWRPLHARETGAIRYRWAVEPKYAGPLPAWVASAPSISRWWPLSCRLIRVLTATTAARSTR